MENADELNDFQRGYVQGQRDAEEARVLLEAELVRLRTALRRVMDSDSAAHSRSLAASALQVSEVPVADWPNPNNPAL